MKPVAFAELARMPILEHYEEAFRKATGVSLRLVSPVEPKQRVHFGDGQNAFCTLVGSIPEGCNACLETQADTKRSVAATLAAQQVHCFAGLTEIAVPVVIDGRHVATLMSGQVFRRAPTERDFETMIKKLGCGLDKKWEKKAREAYFKTPVVTMGKLEAIVLLLSVFARHLSDDAGRDLTASPDSEPITVRRAKEFVLPHSGETITFEQVLRHVRASRFHFCKVFKKATGITLTEYVAQVRVIKAKILLADDALRVSDVVFVAGFGSVPRFNSVFKRFVGLSPTEYRAALRTQPPVGPLRG